MIKNNDEEFKVEALFFPNNVYKECFELIDSFTNFLQKQKSIKSNSFIEIIKEMEKNLHEEKIVLLPMGGVSSGKTTFINSILAWDDEKQHFNDGFFNFLPAERNENTFFIWIIERGVDKNIHISFNKDEWIYETVKEAKERTKVLNIEQKKLINSSKEGHIKSLQIVLIKIPHLNKNIKIIDFPGISSQIIKEEFLKLVNMNFCYFIFLKDLTNSEQLNDKILSVIEEIQNFQSEIPDQESDEINIRANYYENVRILSIFFTKKDKSFEPTEEDLNNCDDDDEQGKGKLKQQVFEQVCNDIATNSLLFQQKKFQIQSIYFTNLALLINKKQEKENERQKEFKIFQRFLKEINKFYSIYNKSLIPLGIIHKMNYFLYEIMKDFAKTQIENVDLKVETMIKYAGELMNEFYKETNNLMNEILKKNDFEKKEIYKRLKKFIEEKIKEESNKEFKF